MALSPKQLSGLTAEDFLAVDEMEKELDNYLLTLDNISEVKFVIRAEKGTPKGKANRRLSLLLKRYKEANWGEVDGGVMGDGNYSITLREYKRHYQNHH